MAAKATNTRGRKNKKENIKDAFRNEIILLAVLAASILLFISNFGIGGAVGKWISSLFFGIFGLMAYPFPICLFVGTAFFMSNRRNTIAFIKLVAGVLFVLFLSFFVELAVGGANHYSMVSSFQYGYEHKSGGGMIGGLLAAIICPAFGLIGAYVIDIIVLIISLILLTERSFLGGLKKGSKKVYDSARVDAVKLRDNMERRKEEQAQKRMDKKVEGVALDTKIVPPVLDISDNINELKPTTQPPQFTKSAMEKLFKEPTPEKVAAPPPEPEPEVLPEPTVVEKVMKKPKPKAAEIESDVTQIEQEIHSTITNDTEIEYVYPPISLLKKGTAEQGDSQKHLQETALKLQHTLKNFGVNVTITDVSCGPSVTRYEMQPELGVKVSKIVNLADDIKLNLAAHDIRIEAPISGKAAVGIEVPNKETVMVRFREMIEAPEFKSHSSSICFTAGKDIGGQVAVADIAKMPHLLIAGATGSGKSVCINTIIMSLLYKANPEDVKLILIDPKVVELSVYNGIPHLFIPVVTDPKKAAGALHWAVAEMDDRYKKFAQYQVRDLKGYNKKIENIAAIEDETKPQKLPQIIIVVDELADLMMVAPGEVEDAICRLAQLARAAGIHLIIATQRPSVDVITGLIKANMPSRIAFSVSSGVDSRTILDMVGAEKLLGNGDMLFYPQGYPKPLRVQGPFVSDTEVEAVVEFLKKRSTATYNMEIEEKVASVSIGTGGGTKTADDGNDRDAYFADAARFLIEKDKGSIGMLQRWFKIGFNRAARIMDQLEEAGVVGAEDGTKPRKILMTMEQFETVMEGE
jgi:S-DNA-T family DNA segregation ATPase FtsK/SpoIIIE